MKRRTPKSLKLNRETLVQLTSTDLRQVVGGNPTELNQCKIDSIAHPSLCYSCG
jgi:hypothetical protein